MSKYLALLLALSLAGFLFLYRLGDRDLGSAHEARAAQNAQMILSEGDWGLPRLFNGRVELQKPPLYYWLVAAIAWLRGTAVDAFAVRLPAALAALACLLWVCFFAHRCGRPRAGLIAAVVLATAVHFTWIGRVGRIDMPLTLTVTVALGSFYLGRQRCCESSRGGWGWFLLAYLAIAVGILFKGPIAAVLPLGVAATWIVLRARSDGLPRRELLTLVWGVPLTLAVAAPWFVWANARTDNRLWEVFFWYHNVERGLHGTLVSHSWWFYGPRLAIDVLPWSLLIPLAAWWHWRCCPADRDAAFALTWCATIVGLLSLMSFKRGDYLLPAYPGLALWLGCLADRWLEKTPIGSRRVVLGGAAVVGCIAVVTWWAYIELVEPLHDDGRVLRDFAAEVRRRTDQPVIFFRTEAHEVAFHVGRPLDTILEWENLDWWATRPFPVCIVMPPESAAECDQHLRQGRLQRVLSTTALADGRQSRPLVLLRSLPGSAPAAHQVAGRAHGF
jgi:4-amino-4-deoxy-L-arabinose transferase-like glycosyltransferase